MIFVTLGTQGRDFSRCLAMIDKLIEKYNISDEFIVQAGYTEYKSKYMTVLDFIPEQEYKKYISKADVVITHAGSGALFNSIRYNKKTIAVARLKQYSEMIDNHQLELVEKLTELGYILNGTNSIEDAWLKIPFFIPNKEPFQCSIVEAIDSFITGNK